ncbi:PAS domain-containing protein [Paracraurococcus ruber]|uniref:Photoactive yellow protein n=1 Tax=Paracraurococcus ruber TaxID=77675 RepID=A0ABS1CR33_9PROT|nr:PAS domain-containing protein [Paracraurococcus ruber]MBK1656752.1 hypothetical protein [Paracraurococcus ruber]TDG26710.1 hypothetical protein E2C05_25155 [Paracraurococcus ruber]
MPGPGIPDFDSASLAAEIERLPLAEIHRLPFGAIRLDAEGRITFYSDTERRQSGYRKAAVGHLLFADVAPCLDNDEFRGRIDAARSAGTLDLAFGHIAAMPSGALDVELHVRALSTADGGCWIFLKRVGSAG